MSVDATGGFGEPVRRNPVVTVAALYGAGGSVVGPRVAERLGVPLLDREIPEDVARRTGLSEKAVGGVDEKPRSRMERLAGTLGRASNLTGDAAGSIDRETAERRQEAEDRARLRYVQDAYGVNGNDPSLYLLMLDSTALDLDTCVDLVVTASRARTRRAGTGSTDPKPGVRT